MEYFLKSILSLKSMIKNILWLVLMSFSLLINGQVVYIEGDVRSIDNKPIEGAHIKVQYKNIVAVSDVKGKFNLKLRTNNKLYLTISHVKYATKYVELTKLSDTIGININLKEKIEQINQVIISGKNKPDTVYVSTVLSVEDFEFFNDKLILLAYGKRLGKDAKLYLTDNNQEIIYEHFIPDKPIELYSDYLGNINLVCKNSIYRVEPSNTKLQLYKIPLEDFYQLIKPCIDTLEGNILFSDILKKFPRFKYYSFNPNKDNNPKLIKEVVHDEMDWQYRFEYYNLTNAEKQFAKRLAKQIQGYDEHDVAAAMTGFTNDFFYDPIYAPLFILNDTINIFDHYKNKIFKFINDSQLVGAVDISYHKGKKNKWKKQLIIDEENGSIFALFLKNGYYLLKKIDKQKGKTLTSKKIFYKYAEKIKIKNGYVYYTYKPNESLHKKFLYKEKL